MIGLGSKLAAGFALTTLLAGWWGLHEYGSVRAAETRCEAQRRQDAADASNVAQRAAEKARQAAKAEYEARITAADAAMRAALQQRERSAAELVKARKELSDVYRYSDQARAWSRVPVPEPVRAHERERLQLVTDPAHGDGPG